jgi:endonuclease/exonuclease/phosphatase family metal-dependent hydrolase
MNTIKKTTFIILLSLVIILLFIVSFLWYNNFPPLISNIKPDIIRLNSIKIKNNLSNQLKIASYNIHFGVGYNAKTLLNKRQNYINRLNEISDVLSKIDADIVLLQEVDFNSKRTHNIDQAKYLAKKSNFAYIVKHTTIRQKFYPFHHNIFGNIDHGLCILSKYPITNANAILFNNFSNIPFFLKWLFSPHGALECKISVNDKIVNVINLHLDPWAKSRRYHQINKIKTHFLNEKKLPLIIGGDFNTLPLDMLKNSNYDFQEAPFFINKDELDIKNEKTIEVLNKLAFNEVDLKNQNQFTYPSINPKVKLDYIFAGYNAQIINFQVYNKAFLASDHLPIVADILIK